MQKLFFIIPVYKVEDLLPRCIDSVIGQSYKNIEIILVDDGSPDKSGEICDSYAQKHENIKVIHKENGGLSDARNAGICYVQEIASPDDFLTFLDSDDFVHPLYAQNMIALCEKYSCDTAQCEYEKGSSNRFTVSESRGESFFLTSREALLGYTLKSQSCAKIYRVKLFDGVLYPTGVLNEDEFTTYRAIYNSENTAFTSEKLYYYFQHGTSIMDEIAKKLKNNPHRYDYLDAYKKRIEFFRSENEPEQVMKTHEKICTDIILRYCEQMYLKKADRDTDCVNGTYMKLYRENYKLMIKRKGIPFKRKLMYIGFYVCPYSAVFMGRIFTLRK